MWVYSWRRPKTVKELRDRIKDTMHGVVEDFERIMNPEKLAQVGKAGDASLAQPFLDAPIRIVKGMGRRMMGGRCVSYQDAIRYGSSH